MTCQELDARLDDWVDGTLAAEAAAEVEAHLASCPRCQEQERRMRQLLAHAASLPRSVTPPRDLWPGIARRLEQKRRWSWAAELPPWALAAAATVAVALAAVLWTGRSPSAVKMVEIPAATPEARLAALPETSDPVIAAAEREYEDAANALLEALQKRQSEISPQTLVAVRANLEVIDRALAELREALVKDPSNPELNRMLVATHRKKVDVLRRVVRLSTAL
jgi:negative regulator of sigma E activity